MKKVVLLLTMVAFANLIIAQNAVTVSGTVNNISNNMPVVNHAVMIQTDSIGGAVNTVVTYTNPNGYYTATVPITSGANAGVLTVSTYDCQQFLHSYNRTFGPGNYSIAQNFIICVSSGQSCQANFTYNPAGPLTMQFLDLSVSPNTTSRLWNFGDGSSSTLLNPLHTFPAQGYYSVSLTVGAAGTSCFDIITQMVFVGDSTASGCQAAFTYILPATNSRLVYFTDQSITNTPVSYLWDFGDGTTSTLQNPVHQYAPTPATTTYNVCLTISAPNNVCYDITCQPVSIIGGGQGCQAEFDIIPASGNPLSIYLLDQSTGNIQSWTWDFGDGITQTITAPGNPSVNHTYTAPGLYTACLYISGSDSCFSTKCETFQVGDSISGCQSYFSYMNLPGTTYNTFQFTNLSQSPTPVSCFWNFGDGTTSTEQNPIHTFPSTAATVVYNVCLTITAVSGGCSDTYCKNVVVTPSIPCHADFIAIPSPNSPNTVYFDDNSTGSIQTWTWDFGDGTTATISAPSNPNTYHSYQLPGFYNVCLYIAGADSCRSVKCETIAVMDSVLSCQAQFTWFPVASNTGNTIQFSDLSSGNITQWFWNFGDSTTSALQNPVHTFNAPGTYYVCLTIGGPGCQSVWCANVQVGNASNCVNYFTYSNIELQVNFQGFVLNSTSSQNNTYFWDFGDNQIGSGQNTVHTYTSPGIYYVTLTTTTMVTGTICTYTSGQSITVNSNNWNQIYGQVFGGNFPVTQGVVLLFSLDTANYFVPFVDIAAIDSAGVYYFPMVPQGSFILYAIPFTSGYLPTYYGNTLFWQSATVVTLGTPANPYNIQLIPASAGGIGSGNIAGQIIQGDLSTSMVENITMLLSDQDGNAIKYCQVNSAGQFEFPALAFGTYYLHAELAGCESQNMVIIISEENPEARVALTLSGHSIMGSYETQPASLTGTIAPNPAKDVMVISLKSESTTRAIIEIYSLAGTRVSALSQEISAGSSRVSVAVDQLVPGMYLVKVSTENGLQVTRKLVVSR